jgi:S-adenosylmethionine:tRNA ribosyltransferase-isomerase
VTPARLRTADFDYHLPPDRIAQHPAARRDSSRLLVLDRETGELAHRRFAELRELIPPGDVLVLNRTRVFPARLLGRRAGGGAAEVLLLRPDGDELWRALVRPGARLPAGRTVEIGEELRVEIVEALEGGERLVRLLSTLGVAAALERYGRVPLPPYVRREPEPEDAARYQTVYARESGSVAAPTAGLHFTPELLAALRERGVEVVEVLLHVGPGTFRPVDAEDPTEHPMHAEWYRVEPPAAAAIDAARRRGGAVWAVGTTVARTLESSVKADGRVAAGQAWTELFIRPPYVFRAVDRLITNFHLPRSTLLMLVAAFAGYQPAMRAYRSAIEEGYRFYSYGDAMVVV